MANVFDFFAQAMIAQTRPQTSPMSNNDFDARINNRAAAFNQAPAIVEAEAKKLMSIAHSIINDTHAYVSLLYSINLADETVSAPKETIEQAARCRHAHDEFAVRGIITNGKNGFGFVVDSISRVGNTTKAKISGRIVLEICGYEKQIKFTDAILPCYKPYATSYQAILFNGSSYDPEILRHGFKVKSDSKFFLKEASKAQIVTCYNGKIRKADIARSFKGENCPLLLTSGVLIDNSDMSSSESTNRRTSANVISKEGYTKAPLF